MRLCFVALAACSHAAPAIAPVPVPAVATDNPCFANQPPIKATAMHQTLEQYAWSLYLSEDEPAPPPTTYGTCKVDRNKVTAANGTPVAELGCGVRVLTRGIVDDLGLQIGATGRDVIARKHATTALTCLPVRTRRRRRHRRRFLCRRGRRRRRADHRRRRTRLLRVEDDPRGRRQRVVPLGTAVGRDLELALD